MTVQEAWNRTNNLVATSILALAGFAFLPEAFIEDHQIYKVDDGALFIVGISAIIWYNMKKNSVSRSMAPVIMTVSAMFVKIAWLVIEFKDKEVIENQSQTDLIVRELDIILDDYFKGYLGIGHEQREMIFQKKGIYRIKKQPNGIKTLEYRQLTPEMLRSRKVEGFIFFYIWEALNIQIADFGKLLKTRA